MKELIYIILVAAPAETRQRTNNCLHRSFLMYGGDDMLCESFRCQQLIDDMCDEFGCECFQDMCPEWGQCSKCQSDIILAACDRSAAEPADIKQIR